MKLTKQIIFSVLILFFTYLLYVHVSPAEHMINRNSLFHRFSEMDSSYNNNDHHVMSNAMVSTNCHNIHEKKYTIDNKSASFIIHDISYDILNRPPRNCKSPGYYDDCLDRCVCDGSYIYDDQYSCVPPSFYTCPTGQFYDINLNICMNHCRTGIETYNPSTGRCDPVVIDCSYTAWGPWSKCDASCGKGIMTRVRDIIAPDLYGSPCPDNPVLKEIAPCDSGILCPIDCSYTWSVWSSCDSKTGTQYSSPIPIIMPNHGGQTCPPNKSQKCPVDCKLSDWSTWSDCNSGIQVRTRDVLEPEKNHGKCGPLIDIQYCPSP